MGIFELMVDERRPPRPDLGRRLDRPAPHGLPQSRACARCARPACAAIFEGVTTIEEVVRETVLEDESQAVGRVPKPTRRLRPASYSLSRQRTHGLRTTAMPTFKFEAMDTTGAEVKDSSTRRAKKKPSRRSGRWATSSPRSREEGRARRATEKKAGRRQEEAAGLHHRRRQLARQLCTFTRQFSTLQDAGLPVLRSLQDPRRAR